jgi:hypothetical protein
MKKLFSTLFGSKLYGTSTPSSDRDLKHVVLPELSDLLLGKKVQNLVKKTNTQKNTRNSAEDTDEEFVPLQVFANDFYNGQTYALELAFAVDKSHCEQAYYDATGNPVAYSDNLFFVQFVKELRTKFLTSNVRALMGYAVNQVSMYSFKGDRLNVVVDVLDALKVLAVTEPYKDQKLSQVFESNTEFKANMLSLAEKHPKYFKKSTYLVDQDRYADCFVLLEKTMPFSNTVAHTFGVVTRLREKYGSRAEAASETNVDWKATMHALRVVQEGLSLLQYGKLEFPFHPAYASYLLKVKRGEENLEVVKTSLSDSLQLLKQLEKTTSLPPHSEDLKQEFESWLSTWLHTFYNLEV